MNVKIGDVVTCVVCDGKGIEAVWIKDVTARFPVICTGCDGAKTQVIRERSEERRPTIAELEEILQEEGDRSVQVMPSGEVRTVRSAPLSKQRTLNVQDEHGRPLKLPENP